MDRNEELIKRTFELAERGRGFTSPNPVVGTVIEKNGEIIAEGWHQKYGCDHAERMALKKAGEEAAGATLYVNLEPCDFEGQTPPCTDAIIEAGIKKVVVSMVDPNPKVSGQGLKILEDAGIEVVSGVLEEEAERLNKGFIKLMEEGRPWITLKLALTTDGYIGDTTGKSQWITSEKALKYVRDERLKHDSVMVGLGTVLKDNPSLLPNNREGYIPYRIVMDESLMIPYKAKLVNGDYTDRTVIITGEGGKEKRWNEFQKRHVNIVKVSREKMGWIDLSDAFLKLGKEGISSVYCEGGGRLAASLVETGFVDELQLFIAPKILGEGIKSFDGLKKPLDDAILLDWDNVEKFGPDILLKGHLR
ncbi:MAG: bifunctional diaminohydroxyphosphoribosylaminopyrimidine deaminase/5-amino-6-(5-phosphoribosylamino)uracil reductase RibD [Candidatus Marinimicrobia bacterium]|nr:bifunctional diaminohydroxyphosphoribosylaminopyrimidine deaminase/5-amino-6-(5-phosphoribosylamino)uracil reductase RibD [Candidatus Neomarinimicrobiota bacterium]